jgi:hypothetical protein
VRTASKPEKHRPGQTAVLRLRREPGLGEHRRTRLQPGLLNPAHSPPGRPSRQGLGHQTLALPALGDRREFMTRARRSQLLLTESALEKDLRKLLLENTGRLKQLLPVPG